MDYQKPKQNLENLRFLSRGIHFVKKIIISDVIYSTGLGIHDRYKITKAILYSCTYR